MVARMRRDGHQRTVGSCASLGARALLISRAGRLPDAPGDPYAAAMRVTIDYCVV